MKERKKADIRFLTVAAMVAALYALLTELSALLGLSSGVIQCRLSEALCVLPAFTAAAIPGLFIGCLISNLLTGALPLDILFGSLATLLGALGAYLLRKAPRIFVPLPTLLANAVAVPLLLSFTYGAEGGYLPILLFVLVGEAVSAVGGGCLLYAAIVKYRKYLQL